MNAFIRIENEMPASITCRGIYFEETESISMQELILFIERDLYLFFRNIPCLNAHISVSLVERLGMPQIRVGVGIAPQNSKQAVQTHIEKILWAYNQQTLLQDHGRLKALASRFLFRIDVFHEAEEG